MAISRAKKEELVARYADVLSQSDGFFVAEYRAITVAETEQIRHKLRGADGEYMVTKNTLFKIALEQLNWPVPDDLLAGPVGIIFSKGNLPGVAKEIIDFAKPFENRLTIKGGVMGTSIFAAGDLEAISNLPTLPEIQAQILGILGQPSQQLVNVIHAADAGIVNVLHPAVSQVLNVLNAHIEQNLKSGDAA